VRLPPIIRPRLAYDGGEKVGELIDNSDVVKVISIVHINAWEPEKHSLAFLQPLIEGYLRRKLFSSTIPAEEQPE
jgi:hypothetical protein